MGFNTTVLILNDGLYDIERHPEQFVKGIVHKARWREGGGIAVGSHCNAVTVMRTEHADVFRLYATHGNSIVDLSSWWFFKEQYLGAPPHAREFYRDMLARAEETTARLKEIVKEHDRLAALEEVKNANQS
jgi:hypothetical protein